MISRELASTMAETDSWLLDHPDIAPDIVSVGIETASAQLTTDDIPEPLVEYQRDPIGFARDILGIPEWSLRWSAHPEYPQGWEWDGTPDPIARMLEAVAEGRDVGLESGTGTGKSFTIAILVLWFVASFPEARVFTYAPKEEQLRSYAWAEITALWPKFQRRFPSAKLDDLRIRMHPALGDKWGAKGVSVAIRVGEKSATKAQGAHAPHLLLIVEEGPGVRTPVWTALENTRTGGHNIQVAVGNPDGIEDPLHRWCLQETTEHIICSGLDHVNAVVGEELVPGAVTAGAIQRRRVLYRNAQALFDSRVRGISPDKMHGVALQLSDANMESWSPGQIQAAHDQRWTWWAGIDFGAWRFAFVLGGVDRAKRLHVFDELFSQWGDTLTDRAQSIVDICDAWDIPGDELYMVGDSANPTDIREMNAAFERIKRDEFRIRAVAQVNKARNSSVEKLNLLLGSEALLFRRGIGAHLRWWKGANAANEGEETTGSRLMWEVRNWRYPDDRPDEEQDQEHGPDDSTADGADAVAALRYMTMTWLRPAKTKKRKRKPKRDHDEGLERLARRYRDQLRELRKSA